MPKKILIAGASGFIGNALIQALLQDESLILVALVRNEPPFLHPRLIWKQYDLYSLTELKDLMLTCDAAYYLAHSILPTARFTQGNFYDFDLLFADQFKRAVDASALRRVIYLRDQKNRFEIEETLKKIKTEFILFPTEFNIETPTQGDPLAIQEFIRLLVHALDDQTKTHETFDITLPDQGRGPPLFENEVQSIQRLPLPKGKNAEWVSEEYFRWLPRFLSPFIKVKQNQLLYSFQFLFIPLLVLEKNKSLSTSDRTLFSIQGGVLAKKKPKGHMEFREVLDRSYTLVSVHHFQPALPWFLYRWTQAIVHLMIMNAYAKYLAKINSLLNSR